ncbi:hypothetical protein TrLO_g4397 [Triparma laevis f. longispina]|uniref:ADP,ATP carrier protein n=1 Tax=Triparma laevis f. longispina TaxID=1714387 RepID=A0A9W6ZJV2_9STRA|nr:hypothetical protein TrLO_g4397 [Triparma laevis f. longispina]
MSSDPFPMSSPAAKALSSTVTADNKTEWSNMKTRVRNIFTGISGGGGAFEGVDSDSDDEGTYTATSTDVFDAEPLLPFPQRALVTLESTFHTLYGPLPLPEILRSIRLSLPLFFLIGSYWLLRSLKDPVITAICGVTVIPRAKMLSVFVVLGIVTVYNWLLDRVERYKLFYYFGIFYFLIFTFIAIRLSSELEDAKPNPSRLLGWISYCTIESFGSLMVSLFWSFTNSITPPDTQKSTYGFLTAVAQIGSILGPTIVTVGTGRMGIPMIYFIGACGMLGIVFGMHNYISIYGHEPIVKADTSKSSKKGAGIMEGINLFITHNYVKGIFAISCLFMVEVTIIDYTMKVLAKEYFEEEYPCFEGESCWGGGGLSVEGSKAFASFMGVFGQSTNTLSFLFSFLGTSFVIRSLGLRLTLLLFPTLCLIVILIVRMFPDLWVVFGAMMLLKGFSYALNNPTKEILYQPTSQGVKYKSKSWIDIFGARGSKAIGSIVTDAFKDSAANLVANGSLVAIAVASFLIFNARFMGRKYDEYMESGYVVGGDNSGLLDAYSGVEEGIEMAGGDEDDTACGLEEEGQSEVEDEGGGEEEEDEEEEEEGGGDDNNNRV